jgi:hypothetical protein
VECESGAGWSAASEGVPAALRLSKSAQSADYVHFSDSAELKLEFLKAALHRLLAVTIDQDCAFPSKLARFYHSSVESSIKNRFFRPENR